MKTGGIYRESFPCGRKQSISRKICLIQGVHYEENNNYYKNIISRKKNAVLVSSKKCTGKNELLKIILKKIINIKKKLPNFTSPAHSKKIKALL